MRATRMILAAVLVCAAAVASAQESAAEKARQTAATGKSTYGSAGCGLGSLVFGDQPGMVQVIAATLNGTGIQTFGITSGTSNCGQPAIGELGTRTFIEANREILAKDAARGSGETISTLTHLAGCAEAEKVGAALQRTYEANFSGAETSAVADRVISTLRSDATLACNALL